MVYTKEQQKVSFRQQKELKEINGDNNLHFLSSGSQLTTIKVISWGVDQVMLVVNFGPTDGELSFPEKETDPLEWKSTDTATSFLRRVDSLKCQLKCNEDDYRYLCVDGTVCVSKKRFFIN